jgi:hypothetical protein
MNTDLGIRQRGVFMDSGFRRNDGDLPLPCHIVLLKAAATFSAHMS